MAFFLLSLIGIPFTGGFFGKFYVFTAALHRVTSGSPSLAWSTAASPPIYYLRLLMSVYGKPTDDAPVQLIPRLKGSLTLALFLTVAATLILGIFPGRILAMARAGAATFTPVSGTGH